MGSVLLDRPIRGWCSCLIGPLTGYDNQDAVSGDPDEEVYLYKACVLEDV
jgi:hypothetical protein